MAANIFKNRHEQIGEQHLEIKPAGGSTYGLLKQADLRPQIREQRDNAELQFVPYMTNINLKQITIHGGN